MIKNYLSFDSLLLKIEIKIFLTVTKIRDKMLLKIKRL
jgi:hypothetical protein